MRQKLANDEVVKGAGFDVVVKNGEVTLKGTVADQRARDKAEKITRKSERRHQRRQPAEDFRKLSSARLMPEVAHACKHHR